MRSWIVAAALLVTLAPGAGAQSLPTRTGALEVQIGMAGITLPETSDGAYSAQPEFRLGLFLSESLQLQVQGSARIWPLGSVAPGSIGVAGQVVWYPALVPAGRGLYFLGGAGGARNNPPFRYGRGTSFDPFVRGGLGYKIPLAETGIGFLSGAYLSTEYRLEYLLEDDASLVSGGAFSFSFFL